MVVGIDGLGASGKSTLARQIARRLAGDVRIIHTDDYYKHLTERTVGVLADHVVSPDFDWDRMEREVFDVPREGITLVVGVYALQKRFFDRYDYTIWVQTPREVRLRRMIEREGETVAHEWLAKWSAREENYYKIERPDTRATCVFANIMLS